MDTFSHIILPYAIVLYFKLVLQLQQQHLPLTCWRCLLMGRLSWWSQELLCYK